MKKFWCLLLFVLTVGVSTAATPINVNYEDGIYHIILSGSKIKKQIQFVSSKDGEAPIIVLVCLVKDGKFGCKVRPTLSIENRESYQNIFNS